MQKTELTADLIKQIIQDKRPTSLTQIYHTLGGSGSVSGSFSKQLKNLVPNIAELLDVNKPAPSGKDSPVPTQPAKDAPADPKLPAEAKMPAVKKAEKPSAVKPASKKPSKTAYPIPEICPYRHSGDAPSGYAMAWSILYAHRATGISKPDLISKYQMWSGKLKKLAVFDCQVVCSAKSDGSAHRSAMRASGSYWVDRENDFLRLRLVSEKK